MAETEGHTSRLPEIASDSISRLRVIAESHLQEIDQENQQADMEESKKVRDFERYTKRRRGKDGNVPNSNSTPTPKMRSAQDVLHRLQWDGDLDISRFKVGYLERFDGIKETPASNWVTEVTDEEWIPQHRIKYFKRVDPSGGSEVVVWDRDQRIDTIFGSGMSSLAGNNVRSEEGGVELTR
ncbi:uncharacterized protein A1O9_10740 [Exophiala aquamarina CBS 119918]|uniref:MJ1316 RNA cyclic group end recognition domain-containing protein n=1 Tax=Exophiala aquamarina CBS 119918 TaxID=1182545 RepID=A0A072P0V3_9EURO|nr:uncharacterized protein A1O9_10740 [Exophiala aquamarina CBS 119918]KEF53292.1 hypothetical protein A1O9_10740 [Exophiala aquamarina CBS 119918]